MHMPRVIFNSKFVSDINVRTETRSSTMVHRSRKKNSHKVKAIARGWGNWGGKLAHRLLH